jgi:DNA-directed RNA polymerase subunit RPC12/RpoP
MEPNEYKCAWCGGIFELVRNEEWNNEKADEEYKKLFPHSSMENRQVVCDDCWQEVKPT